MSPLAQRLEDIPQLVEHFLNLLKLHAGRRISGVEPQALEILCRHQWPGNVRELKNVIERAVVLGIDSTIGIEDLSLSPLGLQPAQKASSTSIPQLAFQPISIAELEQQHIGKMLEYAEGNKSKAAQLLGIERSTLDRKLKKYASD